MDSIFWLKKNLSDGLSLPQEAVDWLISLYDSFQFFDDIADGDEVSRETFDKVLWDVFVSMPQNHFFVKSAHQLIPLVGAQILKWQASDKAERNKNADAKSFVWRAGYYDIVLFCVALVHGPSAAIAASENILRLYGEKFNDYLEEFKSA
jgi:hypothetical protein